MSNFLIACITFVLVFLIAQIKNIFLYKFYEQTKQKALDNLNIREVDPSVIERIVGTDTVARILENKE